MPALRKPLPDVTLDDLLSVIEQEWPEDEQLEFKRALPTAEGVDHDRWVTHGDRVGEPAQRGLFKEVVAFANSLGGDLILGIAETKDNPRRASQSTPLPNCRDLAERLAMAARSLIEPQIPRLEVRGIAADDAGAGFVVIRVPRSRAAPHRLTLNRECYRRRRDSSEAMTMREIQDLTLSVARGLEAVERRLVELREQFKRWRALDEIGKGKHRLALRVTGFPTSSDIYVERVHNIAAIRPSQERYWATISGGSPHELVPMSSVHAWRPIVRGTQAESSESRGNWRTAQQLFCDGGIVYQASVDSTAGSDQHDRGHLLYPGWLFGVVLNALSTADRFRDFAGASGVDYALEIEIATSAPLPIMRMGGQWYDVAGTLDAGEHLLPRYVVGGADDRAELLNAIWRDFWNSVGIEPKDGELAIAQ